MSDRTAIFYFVARLSETGDAEPVDLTQRVISFSFTERESGMSKLVLTVDNKDLANFDDPLFEYGGRLRVAWGNGRGVAPLRDVVIKKVVGGRELTVTAVTKEGSLLDTKKRRRRFENVRRSDVVRQIARENGFREPDVEDTPELFPSIAQSNLTDGQLLRKLAHLEGFEFYIDFDGLHWHRRRVDQAPIREYIYFIDQEDGEVIDFNVENDVTRRPGKVTVKGRNPKTKTDIEATTSNEDDPDRDVLADVSVAIDGESAQLTFRKEVAHETTISSNVESQVDAEREAKAAYRKAQQQAVKMSLDLRGDPTLIAKSVVQVSGIGRRLSGRYYVKEVVHTLDASGGYNMSAKVITDGFQGGKGRGGASADSGADIQSLAGALRAASINDLSVGVVGETGELTGPSSRLAQVQATASALADALDVLSARQGDDLARGANQVGAALAKLASSARATGAKETSAAAANAAALCRRLAEGPREVLAKGKKNDKDVSDATVKPVPSVDADGRPVTRYVDTGGRER